MMHSKPSRLPTPTLLLAIVFAAAPGLLAQTNLLEDFSTDPRARGWVAWGDTNLFQWNRNAQSLDVVWDSARPNSFFYWPFNQALSRQEDFQLGFDIRLDSVQAGVNPAKTSTF